MRFLISSKSISLSAPLRHLISGTALDPALESHSIRTRCSREPPLASPPFLIHIMVLIKPKLGIENGGDLS